MARKTDKRQNPGARDAQRAINKANLKVDKAAKKPAPEREVVVEHEAPAPDTVRVSKSKVKQCAYCKHYYLKPCDEKAKDKCPNWLFLQQRAKKGRK